MRSLNLCGFCLRPGFGYPGDEWRIEQARRVYAAGLQYKTQVQTNRLVDFLGEGGGRAEPQPAGGYLPALSPVLLPHGSRSSG